MNLVKQNDKLKAKNIKLKFDIHNLKFSSRISSDKKETGIKDLSKIDLI